MLAITLYSSLLSIGRETKAQVTYLKITELEIRRAGPHPEGSVSLWYFDIEEHESLK